MFYNPLKDKSFDKQKASLIAGNNPNLNKLKDNQTYGEMRKILSKGRDKKETTHVFVGSNKGGCGKTNLSIQLSYFLNARGYSVLLVDADAQSNVTCSLLEDEAKVESDYSFYDLLTGQASLENIIGNVSEGLDIMGANQRLSEVDYFLRSQESSDSSSYFERDVTKNVQSNEIYLQTYNIFKKLGEKYDFVIYDTNPETNRLNRISMQVCDIALIPIQPKESSAKAYAITLTEINDSFVTINRDTKNIRDRVKLLFNNNNYIPERKKQSVIKKIYQHFAGDILDDYIDYSFELGEASDVGWPAFIHSEVSDETIQNLSSVVDEVILLAQRVSGEKKNTHKRRHMFLSDNA